MTTDQPKPVRIVPIFEGSDTMQEIFGEVTEGNDRIYSIEPRPHYATDADRFPICLRLWGNGHWCRADGQPRRLADRAAAHVEGQRWLETGRTS